MRVIGLCLKIKRLTIGKVFQEMLKPVDAVGHLILAGVLSKGVLVVIVLPVEWHIALRIDPSLIGYASGKACRFQFLNECGNAFPKVKPVGLVECPHAVLVRIQPGEEAPP